MALIAAVMAAGMIPLNSIRLAGNQSLTEKFMRTLTEVLALLQEREEKKVVDPLPRVQPLVKEYCIKAEADRKAHHEQLDQVNAQISQESANVLHADIRSEQLENEYEQISSSVAAAKAEVARAEAELARARQVLADYHRCQE